MTDKNIEKMRDMLREIKRHAGLIINNIVFTACEATNIQTLASEALALLAEETPPKEPTINEPIKVGIGLLVPDCQSEEGEFTKRLQDKIQELIISKPTEGDDVKVCSGLLTELEKGVLLACDFIDRLQAENKELKKDNDNLSEIESDLNNTVGFLQTGVDSWKKTADAANEKIEKRDKAIKYLREKMFGEEPLDGYDFDTWNEVKQILGSDEQIVKDATNGQAK